MTLDFGSIRDYNSERGFGYLHRTVWKYPHSTSKVFFHIKKIKRKYPNLAIQLDSGIYDGLSFWYDTESTPKGEQASEVWLNPQEIPAALRDSLAGQIEKLWLDVENDDPEWSDLLALDGNDDVERDELQQLDKLTLDLYGEQRRNQLQKERDILARQHRERVFEQRRRIELR